MFDKRKNCKSYQKNRSGQQQKTKMYKNSRKSKNSFENVYFVLSWGNLSAITQRVCNIQVPKVSATRGLRDVCNFWKKKKVHS